MAIHNTLHAFYVIEKVSERSREISSANRAASRAAKHKPTPYAVAKTVDSSEPFSVQAANS